MDLLSMVMGGYRGDLSSPACHCADTTYVPNSVIPLRFPVSTCQIMGARQSAVLDWGRSQSRKAKDVSKILSLAETLH